MYGYIEWTDTLRPPMVTDREILGLRFRCLQIPRRGIRGFLRKRTMIRAAKLLRREGVARAVFPAEFSWGEVFEAQNIRPVDTVPLYRSVAVELVQRRLSARGRGAAAVAVCAPRLTDEVRQIVTELCIRNRYVMLAVPESCNEFCRRLRREYGVPLVQTTEISKAAAAVRFSPDAEGCDETIDLYPGAVPPRETLCLSDEAEACVPAACERYQLLAALYCAGVVHRGEIRIFDPSAEEIVGSQGKKT